MSAKRKSLPTKISQTRSSQESTASSCSLRHHRQQQQLRTTGRDVLLSPDPVAASDMEFEEEDEETEFHSDPELEDDEDNRPAASTPHPKVRVIVFPCGPSSASDLSAASFLITHRPHAVPIKILVSGRDEGDSRDSRQFSPPLRPLLLSRMNNRLEQRKREITTGEECNHVLFPGS